MPIAEVRLEFGRGTGPGIPRADLCALLLVGGAPRGAGDLVDADVPGHESGAVTHTRATAADGDVLDTLVLDLASLESAVTTVLVVIRAEGGPLGRIPGLRLRALVEGAQPVRLDCGGVTGGRMLVVGECYRDAAGERWRLRAAALTAPLMPATPRPARPTPVVLPPAGTCAGPGLLRIAFCAEGGGGARIDLCALFELADGRKGVVQPLGGAAGALRLPPYVRLDGDRLTVNLDQAARFRRVLVFLALRGAGRSFADVRGTVTVRPDHGPPQDFPLDPGDPASTVCALLLLTPEGDALRVRREARHLAVRRGVSPQRTVDYAYGWGLVWTPAAL
ncbi:Tellurium resistance [Actinacidiphila paucisporea]|uniref:Tellurium resistance n=1 Tax=Actinacidiphila paucisporea TaxID=310782 RepID=UPI000D1B8211|nr:Tellurium resistance [Actinacidiphila paucisporea]